MQESPSPISTEAKQELLDTVEQARASDQIFNTFDPAFLAITAIIGIILLIMIWYFASKLAETLKKVNKEPDPIRQKEILNELEQNVAKLENKKTQTQNSKEQPLTPKNHTRYFDIGPRPKK